MSFSLEPISSKIYVALFLSDNGSKFTALPSKNPKYPLKHF